MLNVEKHVQLYEPSTRHIAFSPCLISIDCKKKANPLNQLVSKILTIGQLPKCTHTQNCPYFGPHMTGTCLLHKRTFRILTEIVYIPHAATFKKIIEKKERYLKEKFKPPNRA